MSLLNTNLVGRSLAHCINIVAPKHIIVAAELADALDGALDDLENGPTHLAARQHATVDLSALTVRSSIIPAWTLRPGERRHVTIDDRALYMYTSGTTGLPKAAIIDHRRLMTWSHWFAGMMDTGPADRMYNCLPLYHSIGGVVATGAVLVNGGSVVIAREILRAAGSGTT